MVLIKDNHGQQITSEIQLRKIISAYPKILDKRIRPELDRYCFELIKFSRFIVAAYPDASYPMMPLSSKEVLIEDSKTIRLPFNRETCLTSDCTYASLYFMVPGVGHGLRVNGKIQRDETHLVLKIKSTYLHCARAAARAELWSNAEASSQAEANYLTSPKTFISASPFLLMKTMNEAGETELSPRGDHHGFVHLIDPHCIFIPERPGNKVAVSTRNILKNTNVEILMLVPGIDAVMHIHGNAVLTQNDQLLDLAVVKNKRPKLGVLLEQCKFTIKQCKAIQETQLWLNENHINPDRLTRFSKALSAHMNGNGLIGKAATPFINAIVKNDMKKLY